jgi:hypothetical protein
LEEKKMAMQPIASAKETDWTKPLTMAIPKEGYFKILEWQVLQSRLRTEKDYDPIQLA